ncbi:GNAT family N-acetyltransferase [Halobacillus litoralis]|uniref:GNAT family N-acetyltransferase n=1 Tax=Halobacillus litoralis TaxID=45668 RepID=UPI001CFE171C|nr:GNAT family N-acetyltransferase [Halobacillus litoralis]WLR46499.1 GNAT family N-acetyltransferase [Halobacillus litoralis]
MRVRKARHEDVPAIAKVHVDAWLDTYRGLVPDAYLNRMSYEKRERLWEKNMETSHIFVVEDEVYGVFGFATWENRSSFGGYDSELSSLYIQEKFHQLGAGSALLSAVFRDISEKRHHSMIVKVLSENPACKFYEAKGAVKVKEVTITIEEESLDETIYAWELI